MLTNHKDASGIGFKKLDHMNNACLMNLIWKLHYDGNDLRRKVMKNKYRVSNIKEYKNRRSCDSKL